MLQIFLLIMANFLLHKVNYLSCIHLRCARFSLTDNTLSLRKKSHETKPNPHHKNGTYNYKIRTDEFMSIRK